MSSSSTPRRVNDRYRPCRTNSVPHQTPSSLLENWNENQIRYHSCRVQNDFFTRSRPRKGPKHTDSPNVECRRRRSGSAS
jgi:hypothetical protein